MTDRIGIGVTGPAEAVVSADSVFAAVERMPAEVSISAGLSECVVENTAEELTVGAGTPLSGFIAPTLTTWFVRTVALDAENTKVYVPSNEPTITAGSPCVIQLECRHEGLQTVACTTSVTTYEQNEPHAVSTNAVGTDNTGIWTDLYWRWWSGAQSGDWELVQTHAVYIPEYGEPPSDNHPSS